MHAMAMAMLLNKPYTALANSILPLRMPITILHLLAWCGHGSRAVGRQKAPRLSHLISGSLGDGSSKIWAPCNVVI